MNTKERGMNFSDTETCLLIELIMHYKHIIEYKKKLMQCLRKKKINIEAIFAKNIIVSQYILWYINIQKLLGKFKKEDSKILYAEERNKLYRTGMIIYYNLYLYDLTYN